MIPLFDWLAQRPKYLKSYVTKNLEQLQDTPDLAEDFDSPICLAYTTAKIISIFKNVIPCSWQRYSWKLMLLTKVILKFFQKKRKILHYTFGHTFLIWSCFVTLCHASPDIIYTKDKTFGFYNSFPTFWGQKLKFTIHLSLFTVTIHLLLFMTLFTPNFCLFKGGCPLYFKQVLVEFISGLLS